MNGNESMKEAVLKAVTEGKSKWASLRDIYNEIEKQPLVTDYHRLPWKPGGQPRFQCWIRRILTDLIRENKLIRIGRGLYSVSYTCHN